MSFIFLYIILSVSVNNPWNLIDCGIIVKISDLLGKDTIWSKKKNAIRELSGTNECQIDFKDHLDRLKTTASRCGFLRLSRVLPTSQVFTSGYVNTETILRFFIIKLVNKVLYFISKTPWLQKFVLTPHWNFDV